MNRSRIAGKPYAHFFDPTMHLHDDVLPALLAPMDPAQAIGTTASELNSLFEPGYQPVETGFCELPDGMAYIAGLTRFPECTMRRRSDRRAAFTSDRPT